MQTATLHRHFEARATQERIPATHVDVHIALGPSRRVTHSNEEAPWLPERKTGLQLLGKGGGIRGEFERCMGRDPTRLMMPVPIGSRPGPNRDHDIGAYFPDGLDHSGHDVLATPVGKGVFGTLGVAEIDTRPEELFSPVMPAGRQEFARAQHPKGCSGLRPETARHSGSGARQDLWWQ